MPRRALLPPRDGPAAAYEVCSAVGWWLHVDRPPPPVPLVATFCFAALPQPATRGGIGGRDRRQEGVGERRLAGPQLGLLVRGGRRSYPVSLDGSTRVATPAAWPDDQTGSTATCAGASALDGWRHPPRGPVDLRSWARGAPTPLVTSKCASTRLYHRTPVASCWRHLLGATPPRHPARACPARRACAARRPLEPPSGQQGAPETRRWGGWDGSRRGDQGDTDTFGTPQASPGVGGRRGGGASGWRDGHARAVKPVAWGI